MRCRRCGRKACIALRRHNTAFCESCFLDYFEHQVARAIKEKGMLTPGQPVLVAVSGGKDSLALWDVLLRLGYRAEGVHIVLGIAAYSPRSWEKVEAFSRQHGVAYERVDLQERLGLGVTGFAQRAHRPACSACGLVKRHFFNRVAWEKGYEVLATGHNLDDEAATLLGNVLHWQTGYLARQSPVLASTHPRLVKRIKPLFRLTEKETASYAVLRGIDYILEECPLAEGARSLLYKETLNRLERASPGAKHSFLFGFLEKGRPLFAAREAVALHECLHCGEPTTAEVCAFCRLLEQVGVMAPAGVRAS